MDKSDFIRFVNSVRWHCTTSMKTTTLNEDVDRAVLGVCDIRPEFTKTQFRNRIFIDQKKEHRTEKIDGFNGLATYLNEWTNREGLVLNDMLTLKIRFGRERHVTFYYFAHTKTAKAQQQ